MIFTLAVIKFSDGFTLVEVCTDKVDAKEYIESFKKDYSIAYGTDIPIIKEEIIPNVIVNNAPFEHLLCVANLPKELLGLN
jgi:hypothetical protein